MPGHIDENNLPAGTPPPALRAAVLSEGRRRRGARRRTAGIVSGAGVVMALAAALAVIPDRAGDDRRVQVTGPTETTAAALSPASTVPSVLMAATPGGTGRPGDIQLLSAPSIPRIFPMRQGAG